MDQKEYQKELQVISSLIKFMIENSDIRFKQDDDYSHVLSFFYHKLLTHATSLVTLLDINSSDIILVVRSMIEGFALLSYILENPNDYSKNWRSYLPIDYYKYLTHLKSKGITVSDEELDKVQKAVEENSSFYISQKGITIGNKRYLRDWHPRKNKKKYTITDIVKDFTPNLLSMAYKEYSSWHHWSPICQMDSLDFVDDKFVLTPHKRIKTSVSISFYILINAADIFLEKKGIKNYKEKLQFYSDEMSKLI